MHNQAIEKFISDWSKSGNEVADKVTYWNTLLQILGVSPDKIADRSFIKYEYPISNKHSTNFRGSIDAYIPSTKILIEQKSYGVDLAKPENRPNGGHTELITPYEQALRYNANLGERLQARFIVTCNFAEIWIYDIRDSIDVQPIKIKIQDLKQNLNLLHKLIQAKGVSHERIEQEKKLSLAAGELVSEMYAELTDIFSQYHDIDPKKAQRSINALCVRLVFCLYAEDAGLFGDNTEQFHDYLEPIAPNRMGVALKKLFTILDTTNEDRLKQDPFFEADNPELAKFPYVNGGLFRDESFIVPPFTPKLKDILLNKASSGFNWSNISPTIFGAVFESTLNPETRRQGGMHYTSVENIHKVIDPLFLDNLKHELHEIKTKYVQPATRRAHAKKFQEKLASLTFFDPACGSGNFLTETYICLRKLENEAIKIIYADKIKTRSNALSRSISNFYRGSQFANQAANYRNDPAFDVGQSDEYIKVSIQQFFGIEINDFAVSVARCALWIAESQMMDQTKEIFYANWNFLPLKTYTHIKEGDAVKLSWNKVVSYGQNMPNIKADYIISNPPFAGAKQMDDAQRNDMDYVWGKKRGKLDYVSCWYVKAADYIKGTSSQVAFVSTNSIVQGEQATSMGQRLLKQDHCIINFAYRTFVWSNEAKKQASVFVVIVSFAQKARKDKFIANHGKKTPVSEINQYLLDAPVDIITERSHQISHGPLMVRGSQLIDGGNFMLTEAEAKQLIAAHPEAKSVVFRYYNARLFLHSTSKTTPKYCLYLEDADPRLINKIQFIQNRIDQTEDWRKNSNGKSTQKLAARPQHYFIAQKPKSRCILLPVSSSGRRTYIPMDYLNFSAVPTNALFYIDNANLYYFGVLESSIHMAWANIVAGRLKGDFRYSTSLTYNNFPWPQPNPQQKAAIEKTAQGILDARQACYAKYPKDALSDLYNPKSMPDILRQAHAANDKAVLKAYGLKGNTTDTEMVAILFKMHKQLTQKAK